jgi:glycosyltransferase involved in cell wall biosynthesis
VNARPLRIVMLASYPVYKFAGELGIDPKAVRRVTTWNETLADALSAHIDLELHVITATNAISRPVTVARDALSVTYIPMPRWRNAMTLFHYARWQAARLVRQIDPDVVHGIGTEHVWPAVAVSSGRPAVVTVHGVMSRIVATLPHPLLSKRRYFAWLEPRVLRRTRHLISINPYVVETLGKCTSGRIHAVENPINEVFFALRSDPRAGRHLLYVGAIEPLKGFHVLVEALGQIARRTGACPRLVVAGPLSETPYVDRVRQRMAELGIVGQIDFRGFLLPAEIAALYLDTTCLVVPSLVETSSMCSAEAMTAGVPVVASRVGGLPNVVKDGEAGLLTDREDVDQLAAAIQELTEDPDRRALLGTRAREIALTRWRPSLIARQTADVYRESVLD